MLVVDFAVDAVNLIPGIEIQDSQDQNDLANGLRQLTLIAPNVLLQDV